MALTTVRTVAALRNAVAGFRAQGQTVGLVPTMGALHEGHAALVRHARAGCDAVVVSLFVNPRQFGPTEDFASYPRSEAADSALLESLGIDLLYAPDGTAMYGAGFATEVHVAGPAAEGLEADDRPGFFTGVATVVTKLLVQCAPDRAYFGEKDYQQLLVVRRLAADLDLAVAIEGCATERAADGLALSSRNAYLSAAERAIAPALYRCLSGAAAAIAAGASPHEACAEARKQLLVAGFTAVDYLDARDAETLKPAVISSSQPLRLLAAARLGRTRLIDNVAVG